MQYKKIDPTPAIKEKEKQMKIVSSTEIRLATVGDYGTLRDLNNVHYSKEINLEYPSSLYNQNTVAKDERSQIKHEVARNFPYRCWGRLTVRFRKEGTEEYKEGTATGVLIGPSHVLTSAHVLCEPGHVVSWITFSPGVNQIDGTNTDSTSPPYGSSTPNYFWIDPEYVKNRDAKNDIGIIWLEKKFHEQVGWLRVHDVPLDDIKGRHCGTHGYPIDKDFSQMRMFGAGTWIHQQDVSDTHFRYLYHSRSGHSGAGIWTPWKVGNDEGPYIIGINSGSLLDSNKQPTHEAFVTRINAERKKIVLWALQQNPY